MDKILTMEKLNANKQSLIAMMNNTFNDSPVKTCTFKELPNPWGWSALAQVAITQENGTKFNGAILHCYSASTLDGDFMKVLIDWIKTID